jgi:transcriptional regulator with XRE-family HTH domain
MHVESALREAQMLRSLPSPERRQAIRVSARVTQQAIADDRGVDRSTISRWESGARDPRRLMLGAYLGILRQLETDAGAAGRDHNDGDSAPTEPSVRFCAGGTDAHGTP